ncbi:hypothetical protein ACFLSK_00490 [Chloroflexota bacterium]
MQKVETATQRDTYLLRRGNDYLHGLGRNRISQRISHNDIAGGGIIGIGDKGVLGIGLVGVTGIMDIMLDAALKTLGGIDDLEVECNRVVGSSILIVNLQYMAIAVAIAGLFAHRLGRKKSLTHAQRLRNIASLRRSTKT